MPQSSPGFYTDGRYVLNEENEVVLFSPTSPPVLAVALDDFDERVYLYGTNSSFGDSLDARLADGMFVGSQLAFNTTIQGGMFEEGVLAVTYNTPTQPVTLQQTATKSVGDTLDEYYICTSSVPSLFTGYAIDGYYFNGVPQNQAIAVAIAIDGANNEYYDYIANPPELANGMYVGATLITGTGYYVNGVKQTTETPQISKINSLYYTAPNVNEAPSLFTGYVTLNNLFYHIHEGIADLFTGYTDDGYFEEGVGPSERNAVASPIEETGLADRGYYYYKTLPPQRAEGIYAGEGLLEGEGRYSNGGLLSNTKKTPIQSKIDNLYYVTINGDPELFTGYAVAGYFNAGVGPSTAKVVAEAFDGYGLYYDYRQLPPIKAQGIYTLKEDVLTSGEGLYTTGVKRPTRAYPTISNIDGEYYVVTNYIPSLFTGYYRAGYIDPVDYPLLSVRNAVATPVDGDAFVYLDYNTLPPIRAVGLYTTGGTSTLIEGEGCYGGGGFKKETRPYPAISNSNGFYYTVSNYAPVLFTGYLAAGYITNGDAATASARTAVAEAKDRWWRADRYYDYRALPPVKASGLYYGQGLLEGAGVYIGGAKRTTELLTPTISKIDGQYYMYVRNPVTNELEIKGLWQPFGPAKFWGGVAMSSDGSKQTATVSYEKVYVSSDYGRTWTARPALGDQSWADVKVSATAAKQITASFGGYVYVSSDYGDTWTQKLSSSNWINVAISSDGQKQYAATNSEGKLYRSLDSGNTWTALNTPNGVVGGGLSISSDGARIAFHKNGFVDQLLILSEDYGDTWVERGVSGVYVGAAISTDGGILIFVDRATDKMYKSTDFGYTRTQIGGAIPWHGALVSSPNCQYIYALSTNGSFYKSSDFGATWQASSQPKNWLGSIAMSHDGSRAAAVIRNEPIYQNI
jgi:photosystem II stability/assembly factor-like uncharacterized protein